MSLVTSSAIRLVDSRLDANVQELSAADARLLDLKISMLDCFYYKVKMQYLVEMFIFIRNVISNTKYLFF